MRAFRLFREQRTLQSFPRGGHAGLRSRTFNTLSRVSPRQQNASFSSSSPIFQLLYKQPRSFLFRKPFAKRLNSTKPNFNPTPNLGSPEPALSLSQRLRKLSREYGWSALGVYLLLSAVDFPFCFIAVRLLGTDRIGHLEHIVVERFWKIIELAVPNIRGQETPSVEVEGVGKPVEAYAQVDSQSTEVGVAGYDHGVEEAEKRNKAEASECRPRYGTMGDRTNKSYLFGRYMDPTGTSICDS